MDDIIQENQWIIIKLPSGNHKVFTLKANEKVDLGKFGSFQSNDLIGKYQLVPYEIYGDNKIRRVKNLDSLQEFDLGQNMELASNQMIMDDPASQKLSQKEIEELKVKSLQGTVDHDSLIRSLVENNSAFDKKTEFSKVKYIKKKQRKFSKVFTPIKPTARVFCDIYLEKNPEKTREIRIDTLSQMLTLANVKAGSSFLVVDDMSGLLVGAMLEKMQGHGKITVLHDKDSAVLNLVNMMNFPSEVSNTVYTLPWFHLDALPEYTKPLNPEAVLRSTEKRSQVENVFECIHRGGFDGLLVASRFDAHEIVKKLEGYLAPSKPMVVYSPYKESLLNAYNYVRLSRRFVNTQLTESWLREYQVPSNSGTHPMMTTSGSGGYLFNSTVVTDDGVKLNKTGVSRSGTGDLAGAQKRHKPNNPTPENE
ncbi:hypothetical protein BATDEDRAFT_90810 [Batrachochytrium dendrobatidis JAM81]|uniref:tRNA (adenine(58)-N(1))-methyltransferase non-catalytic subunit TRM6 n=2 Tax=Batrachochytrium dendrobatidis TaxID=109871 RepID=F4P9H2_BATDJ|nr:tRNA 1-methyladenosine methyltransferase subunit GCD10 [Batrachochytrium dendrobatidis JAM81]EGF78315.1 hypothetical protein BATDEDRAFT_90810 [Batrachochytrium dendrobatidis JAM81]KAK5667553.1 tRNA (adenine(58)-N(1))-methyltransferase non-catalytic subunit trm6 [Batrachochytrium dendrobatidis]OAJ44430.1 hypothetical protein BDEG_27658 [Batrachochytrium dendrobatidis JEL423]|eukprot:XP_006681277.1 hypothetical protein BATDEDRAFT_90810 [Batrachochytrium dendrobatidis JAM81]